MLLFLLLPAGVLLFLLFSRGRAVRRPNVLLITIDTLRADRVGAYGYRAGQTPVIDRLAAEGLRVEDAFTAVPVTLAAHATLLTGRLPTEHGVRGNSFYRLPERETTLAEVLKQAGYRTAAVVGAAVLDRRFGLSQGFDLYDDETASGTGVTLIAERGAAAVVSRAIAWLNGWDGSSAFLLWAHLFDPHDPYVPPEPFRSTLASSPYDGEIAYVDREVGRLLEALESRGALESTLVILTSDHGESLGEHGEATHGIFLYDATLRVPLFFRGPGIPRPAPARAGPVGLVDVLPTVLGRLSIALPASVSGRDIFTHHPEPREYLYAETFLPRDFYNWSELRGLRSARMKFIDSPAPELYDLASDPGETVNRAAQARREVERFAATLARLAGSLAQQTSSRLALDGDLAERLRSLGYAGSSAPSAGTKPGRGLPDPKSRIHLVERMDQVLALVRSKRLEEAVALLEAILGEDPGNYLAAHTLGDALFDLERDRAAIRAYRLALENGRETGYYHYRLGLLYERSRDYRQAAEEFGRLARLNPAAAKEILERAGALLEQGSAAGALDYFEALAAAGSSGAALSLGIAEARFRLGQYRGCREALDLLLRENPENPQVRSAAAALLKALASALGEKGDLEAATDAFQSALTLAASDFEALANLGLTELKAGNEQAAARAFSRALALKPDDVRLLNIAAELHFRRREYVEARDLLQRSLEADPAQPRISRALSQVERELSQTRQE